MERTRLLLWPGSSVLVVFSSVLLALLPTEARRRGSPNWLESLRPGWCSSLPFWNMPRRSCQESLGEAIVRGVFVM